MPGFNGRGPEGFGSMTGKGRGRCVATGVASPQAGRFGGSGRGMGWRRGYGSEDDWSMVERGPVNETASENEALKAQVAQLQQSLAEIREQLDKQIK